MFNIKIALNTLLIQLSTEYSLYANDINDIATHLQQKDIPNDDYPNAIELISLIKKAFPGVKNHTQLKKLLKTLHLQTPHVGSQENGLKQNR